MLHSLMFIELIQFYLNFESDDRLIRKYLNIVTLRNAYKLSVFFDISVTTFDMFLFSIENEGYQEKLLGAHL